MQDDVEEAEQRGDARDEDTKLWTSRSTKRWRWRLEPDDVGGVRASCDPVLAAEAADELVRAVEGGERCELDPTWIGPVGDGADTGEGHSRRLTGRKGPNHAASQCLGVRQSVPANGCPRFAKERVFAACHGVRSIRSRRPGRYPASPLGDPGLFPESRGLLARRIALVGERLPRDVPDDAAVGADRAAATDLRVESRRDREITQ